MGSLDDRLRDILTDVRNEYDVSDDVIAQIKQAFKEAGYHTFTQNYENRTGDKLLSGQEWFNRFEAELDSGLALPEPMRLWVMKCAEVAAGLTDKEQA